MSKNYNLERFIDAQEHTYQIALKEILNGKKQSHWVWYIFPQLKGFGFSYNSVYYSIENADEAMAYAAHPVLGARLREITQELLKHADGEEAIDVFKILSPIDAIKVRSCMTLFEAVTHEELFSQVLDKMYHGERDEITRKRILNQ